MSRAVRIEFNGAYYHAMTRGVARKPPFLDDDDDRRQFLEVGGELVDRASGASHPLPRSNGSATLDFMTICDYLLVMKQVGIAELKAHLSEYLRFVRRGHTLAVLDRDTPIARISPQSSRETSVVIRRPDSRAPSLARIPLPPPLRLAGDIVEVLMKERQGHR